MLSDNKEIMLGNETDDIVKRLISSFLNNYQKEDLILRNGSNFVFECWFIDLSYSLNKSKRRKFIH